MYQAVGENDLATSHTPGAALLGSWGAIPIAHSFLTTALEKITNAV